jgi:hypothetical protein
VRVAMGHEEMTARHYSPLESAPCWPLAKKRREGLVVAE